MANFNTPQTPTAQLETRVEQVAQAEKLALNSLAQAERFGILAVAAGAGDVSTQERLGGNPLMTAEDYRAQQATAEGAANYHRSQVGNAAA